MSSTVAPPPVVPAPPELSHREILSVFAGLMTAMLLAALDQTIVATALPTIVGELGGLEQLSWVVTAYLLTSTVSVPLYGKVSDLVGRKRLFQVAIVVFVIGSLASGAAQTMGQLIASRAVQGAGAGGLLAMTQTIVGDIVSPRQRGRYMGYIGAVFGVASIAGPLLGGYFVDNLTWRWAFYINVPLGVVAMFVTNRNLKLHFVRRRRPIDFLGAALLAAGMTALLLVTVLGGETYPWASPVIAGLALATAAALAAFVLVERRVPEPILPPELFSNPIFTVAVLLSFIVGVAMFGAIIYLPLFLQVVVGVSATSSGLLLLPLIGGLLLASIVSGRLITRWGRYRVFPIVGTALIAAGLGLLSTMGTDTTQVEASVFMGVVGLGIGNVMQVLVLAVQNAVPVRYLGTATSAAQFFRSIGGTVGVAVFGALVTARVTASLAANPQLQLPPGADPQRLLAQPAVIAQLPAAAQAVLRGSLADAITTVFGWAVPVALVAFGLAWLLREVPLRTSNRDAGTAPGAQQPENAPFPEGDRTGS